MSYDFSLHFLSEFYLAFVVALHINHTPSRVSRTVRLIIYNYESNRKLKFSVKEIHRQSKEMDELRYEKQMDGSSTFTDSKKNEKSK